MTVSTKKQASTQKAQPVAAPKKPASKRRRVRLLNRVRVRHAKEYFLLQATSASELVQQVNALLADEHSHNLKGSGVAYEIDHAVSFVDNRYTKEVIKHSWGAASPVTTGEAVTSPAPPAIDTGMQAVEATSEDTAPADTETTGDNVAPAKVAYHEDLPNVTATPAEA